MSQIPIQIQQQNNKIAALQAAIQGSIERGLLYTLAGDYVLFGCKITEGISSTDMYLALDGQATGDSIHSNPDSYFPAQRTEEYPNIALAYGRAFLSENINKADNSNEALKLEGAPSTSGFNRYDIVYIYVNNSGPAIGIATGTASNSITSLSTADYPTTGDPTLVHGCIPIARVFVAQSVTGISNSNIHDLRNFTGRLRGEDGNSPILTWSGDQIAIDGVIAGPHLTGPTGDSGMGFIIAKTYISVAALEADTTPTGIINGQFAIIDTGNVNDSENARLYLWNDGYTYITDLSGTVGITGNGISSIALLSGDHSPGTTDTYRIYFTDTTHFDFTVYNGKNGIDGTGSGDVVGPGSCVSDNFVSFDGTSGKLIKDSGKKASDFALSGAVGSSNITMNTTKILGRSTASVGSIEEITLGTNLSFTGTTLNATGGGSGSLVYLSTVTASGASAVDIETTIDGTYDTYVLECSGLSFTDATSLRMRFKESGAYNTSAVYYYQGSTISGGTESINNGAGVAYIPITGSTTNTSNNLSNFGRATITLSTPSITNKKCFNWDGGFPVGTNATGSMYTSGTCFMSTTTAITGVRLYPAAGTFNGTFRLYGISNS